MVKGLGERRYTGLANLKRCEKYMEKEAHNLVISTNTTFFMLKMIDSSKTDYFIARNISHLSRCLFNGKAKVKTHLKDHKSIKY